MGTQPPETLGSPRNLDVFQDCCGAQGFSALSTPFASAPSSPLPFWVLSKENDDASYASKQFPAVIPFSWEDIPGTPKNGTQTPQTAKRGSVSLTESEFQFTSGFAELDYLSISPTPADKMFLNGKIRPLRPPPRLQQPLLNRQHVTAKSCQGSSFSSRSCLKCPISAPQSPFWHKRIHRSILKRFFCGICDSTFQEFDPFTAAMEETTRSKPGKWYWCSHSHAGLRDEQPLKSFEPEKCFLTQVTTDDFMESQDDPKRSLSKTSKKWSLKGIFHRHRPRGLQRWISNSSLSEDQSAAAHKGSKIVDVPAFSSGPNRDSSCRVNVSNEASSKEAVIPKQQYLHMNCTLHNNARSPRTSTEKGALLNTKILSSCLDFAS